MLQDVEAVVANQGLTASGATVGLQMSTELVKVMGVMCHVLARMIAMALEKLGELRLLDPVDALDQSNTKLAEVDTPDLHRRVSVVGANAVDSID